MNNKRIAISFALVVAALTASPTGLSARQNSALKVQNKVPLAAIPFPLTEVRLLDGPFREAMLRDQKYLLGLDNDRLLHMFRVTAGLPSTARPYGGWEAPDVQLRGHSMGHFLSACALMYASTGDERFKTKADAVVAELAKVQQALAARSFNAGYLSAFPEEFFDMVDKRERVWAPYYTIHKIMAGLLDMYLLCDDKQALDVLLKQAAWVKFRVDRLTEEQQQAALQTEFGGMEEVLTNLYAITGDPEHLRVARKFDHKRIFDPLSRGEDPLNGLHANTQIPKAIGAARDYELTGEKRYHDVASFFWERVAKHRSYVIGGNSDGESFFPPETFSKHLGPSSTETCNTYNMLKLTRHLFEWEPSAEKMDFYERGLYNHILASQDPATGGFCYYVPLRPGAFKTFSTPEDSFWCCVGTGMENHAKYPDTIYFHDDRSLYLNLFIASELKWKEKGLTVRQETKFPEEDTTRLSIQTDKAEKAVNLALKIRYPSWAQSGMAVAVNGKKQPVNDKPGSYVTIEREWKSGDTVEIRLPMSLRLEAMPDDPKMIALFYGPIALAGDLGRDGLQDAKRYGPSAPQLGRVKPIDIPAFIGDVKDVLAKVKPAPGAPLTFKTDGLGRPQDVTLLPFYKVFEPRYTVYWKVYTPAEWEKRKADLAAAESRRKTIERLTVDAVNINDQQSERDHNLQGQGMLDGDFEGKRWRAARNGWFSYELKLPPDKPVSLVCTYRGSEGRPRSFDVLVDGEKIATQTLEIHPGELFDFEYPLSEQLTRGKQRITVKFQSQPGAMAGSVFDVRVAQIERGEK
ncbi:MAG: glycoside hydrolase family 127 protein [Blastocatellia bacterium]|nr:glycoside hydrolase family 127 protein [Blastocatellia bacterium]